MTNSNKPNRPMLRWTLRALLLLFIPLCAGLAYYGHIHRQQQQAIDALQLMSSKGMDAKFANGLQHAVYIFKYGNVTDEDLSAFVPAFNGHAPSGFGRIDAIRLNGSKVSAEAVQRFSQAVPDCKIEL